MNNIERDVVIEALDQFVSNNEHEETDTPSMAIARTLLEQMQLAKLRDLGVVAGDDADTTTAQALALLREVVRAGNGNMRALKAAIHRASPSWIAQARALLSRVQS